ncbi:ATP-binding protein [Actinoplanes palleronii]|uniref:ATP-binding protein n=1 Tax=Actinoplanes palleronii TaxID=113570 RepID=UPI001940479B|nr:ATP-binding protein [Actinoplanes palleronii]
MTRLLREPSQVAVVRVLRERDGVPVGAAVLVGARHVVTAGHNVSFALGREPRDGDPVRIDFPLVAPGEERVARVRFFAPERPQLTGDLAGLVLDSEPPAGVRPAPVLRTVPPAGTTFRLFGVPENREAGFWLETTCQGVTAGGLIQLGVDPRSRMGVVSGYSGGPLWAPAHRAAFGIVLSSEQGLGWQTAYALPFSEIHRMWPELAEACRPPQPYRGLHCFDEADREWFFGRDRETALLTARVRANPVTLVLAGPGVGKSSLVRAGLVPTLKDQNHLVSYVDAGAPALSSAARLADALLPLTGGSGPEAAARLAGLLGEDGLGHVLSALPAPLVVIIDQLEELLVQDPATARELLALLLPHTADRPAGGGYRMRVLACVRHDYLPMATTHLPAPLVEQPFVLAPLGPEQLATAIRRPAELSGYVRFAPETVARIVADATAATDGVPGQLLPLIELTAGELWQRATDSPIGPDDYFRLGGVARILTRIGDEALRRLGTDLRRIAPRLLTRLVRVGDDALQDTRATVPVEDLPPGYWPVAQRLAGERLITVSERDGQLSVRLAHDALLIHWQRLRDWIAADRAFRRWHAELESALRHWIAGRAKDALLSGVMLRAARGWLHERPGDLSAVEQEFIRASLAHEQRQRRVRRTVATGAAGAVLLLVTAVTVLFPVARDRTADGLQRAAAQIGRTDEATRTILELAAARARGRTDTIRPVLDDLLDNAGTTALLPVTGPVAQLAVAGDLVLIADTAGRLTGWRIGPDGPRRVVDETGVTALAAAGTLVATGDRTGQITVRAAADWAVVRRLTGPASTDSESTAVHALAFDGPRHRLAAVADRSRAVRVVDLSSGTTWNRALRGGVPFPIEHLGFSPGGWVVAGLTDGDGLSDGFEPLLWKPGTTTVRAMRPAASPDHVVFGTPTLLAHFQDNSQQLLDPVTRRRYPAVVQGRCGRLTAAVSGRRVLCVDNVTGEQVGTGFPTMHRIFLFDGARQLAEAPGRPDADGPYAVGDLIAAAGDGVVRVIRPPARPPGSTAEISFARFRPDGTLLALHDDNVLELLNPDGSARAAVTVDQTGTPGDRGTAEMAPDGSFVALLARPGTAATFEVSRYELPGLRRTGTAVVTAEVDPGEPRSALTVLGDGRIVVRSNDDLLIYPARLGSAPPRHLTLSSAAGRSESGTTVLAARPASSQVAVVAPDGSGFQLLDVDRGTTGPAWGPMSGGETRNVVFPSPDRAVVIGEGGTDEVDLGRNVLDRDPPAAPAEATGAVGQFTSRPLSSDDADSVAGWPRVLADWGLSPDLDRLWPADGSARVPGEARHVLLTHDRKRFAVVRHGAVEVYPTDVDLWRQQLCAMTTSHQDRARERLGPVPWLVDPC